MTDDDRKELVRRLRPEFLIVEEWHRAMLDAAMQLEADGSRIADLEKQVARYWAVIQSLALEGEE